MNVIFRKIHLALALPFGCFIALLCATGSLMLFEDQLVETIWPERYRVTPQPEQALPLDELVARIEPQLPDSASVTGIEIYPEPDRSYLVHVTGKGKDVRVNPYTGEVLGPGGRPAFFARVRLLHRQLLHQPEDGGIRWGKWLVGTATLAFTGILLSGLVTAWPRNRRQLLSRLKVKLQPRKFRFWYDLHVTGGIYASLLLLLLALTGLSWNFPWYRTSFYTLLGADPAEVAQPKKPKVPETVPQPGQTVLWNQVAADLKVRYPAFRSILIKDGEATVSPNRYGNVRAADQYRFDPTDGRVTRVTLQSERSRYNRLRNWVYCLHTGCWGGTASRLLYLAAVLLGLVLPGTGYYFYRKKRRRP